MKKNVKTNTSGTVESQNADESTVVDTVFNVPCVHQQSMGPARWLEKGLCVRGKSISQPLGNHCALEGSQRL